MSRIDFPTKPIQTVYKDYKTGELVKQRRRPPAKIHEFLPQDQVSLKSAKNLDWPEGETVTIKHISYRSPNVLQIIKKDGQTTFVESSEVNLEKKVGRRRGKQVDDPIQNKYLLWP